MLSVHYHEGDETVKKPDWNDLNLDLIVGKFIFQTFKSFFRSGGRFKGKIVEVL